MFCQLFIRERPHLAVHVSILKHLLEARHLRLPLLELHGTLDDRSQLGVLLGKAHVFVATTRDRRQFALKGGMAINNPLQFLYRDLGHGNPAPLR